MGPVTRRVLGKLRDTPEGVTEEDLRALGVYNPRYHVLQLVRDGRLITEEREHPPHDSFAWTTRWSLVADLEAVDGGKQLLLV